MRYYLSIGGGLIVLLLIGLAFFLPSRALVYNADLGGSENEDFDVSSYLFKKSDKSLPLTAEAYLVADLQNSEAVIKKNEKKIFPIASVTKLMTVLVAQELIKPDQIITVSQTAYNTYGNSGHLRVGQKLAARDILYPLLLSSSNDAAEALAEAVGRAKFLAEMNNRARQLGMTDTFFADPSGLSPLNVSTAEDLAKLAGYIYRYHQDILAITCEKKHQIGRQTWQNVNNIALMKYYIGGKNGYTEEANRTLVSLFEVPIDNASSSPMVGKKSRPLALVLLQSDDRKKDTKNLINYLAHYVSYLGGKNGFVPVVPTNNLPKT